MLTREDFCTLLRSLPPKYHVAISEDESVTITLKGRFFCLITAVCHYTTGEWFAFNRFHKAGGLIGMDHDLRHIVVSCIDIEKWTPDEEFRQELIAAITKSEPEQQQRPTSHSSLQELTTV